MIDRRPVPGIRGMTVAAMPPCCLKCAHYDRIEVARDEGRPGCTLDGSRVAYDVCGHFVLGFTWLDLHTSIFDASRDEGGHMSAARIAELEELTRPRTEAEVAALERRLNRKVHQTCLEAWS